MKKNKIILIVICVFLLVVVTLAGVGIYLYLKTDLLKTPQQLFYKYITQNSEIFEMNGAENIFQNIKTIESQKFSDEIEISVQTNQEELSLINDFSLNINGTNDKEQQKSMQQVNINYKDEEFLKIDYLKEGEKYAIKSDEIVNGYVALENKNLKQLFTKMGLEDVSQIPDSFNFSNIEISSIFTQEDVKYFEEKYGQIIYNRIPKENYYAKEEIISYQGNQINSKVYGVQLNQIEITTILKEILENLKNEEIILNYYKNIVKNEENYNEFTKHLNELISKINSNVYTTQKAFDLCIYTNEKQIVRTQIKLNNFENDEEMTVNLENSKKEDGTENIDLLVNSSLSNETFKINIIKQVTQEKLSFSVTISSLETLYNISIDVSANQKESNVNIILNSENEMLIQLSCKQEKIDTIEIPTINNQNSVIINNCTQEQLQTLFSGITTKVQEVIIKKMQQLDIHTNNSELENTINEMEQQEITMFNMQFMSYVGEQKGSNIRTLLSRVLASNLTYNDKIVSITFNINDTIIMTSKEEEINNIINQINIKEEYKVKLEYNENGYATQINIEKI